MKRGEALYVQGSAYFYGLARERIDHAKAYDLWAQAAAEGFGGALGRCLFFGCGGFEKDELKAFRGWNEMVKCFVMKEGEVAEMCKGRGQARGGRILV